MGNTQTAVRYTLIGGAVALDTAGTIKNYTDIADGALGIVDRANALQDSVTVTTTPLRFVVRNGSELIFSPEFTQGQVTANSSQEGVLSAQQISYIGYNLTNGSIDTTAQTSYTIKVEMIEDGRSGQMENERLISSTYVSQFGDGQYEIALGLHTAVADNLSNSKKAVVDVITQRVYDGAVTSHTGSDGQLWKVTKGSRYATLSSDGTTAITIGGAGTAADVLAGAYLDLAGVHYKIDSLYDTTNGIVKLDMPWQDASGYVINNCATTARTITCNNASATALISGAGIFTNVPIGSVVYINVTDTTTYWQQGVTANAVAGITFDELYAGTGGAGLVFGGGTAALLGNWGIRFRGQEMKDFQEGIFKWRVPKFNLYVSDEFDTATARLTRAAVRGNGTGEQIAQEEWFAQGNRGNKYRRDFIAAANVKKVTVDSTLYDCIDIKFLKDDYTTIAQTKSAVQIKIVFPDGGTPAIADITTVLAGLSSW